MLSRRFSPLAAACVLAALLPAVASAATIDVQTLASTADNLVVRNGAVYALQPSDNHVTAFDMQTGEVRREVNIPTAGVIQGAAAGPGGLYIGLADDSGDRGFAILNDGPGVSRISLAGAYHCGPHVMAWAADLARMFFYTCETGGPLVGGGVVDAGGGSAGLPDPGGIADQLLYYKGQLFVVAGSYFERRAVTASSSILEQGGQVGDAIGGMAIGPDGNLWMTYTFSGKVVEMPLDGSAPPKTIVSGLDHPHSIATDADTPAMIEALGHGTAAWVSSGHDLVRIDYDGTVTHIPMGDFRPAQIVVKGDDVWTIDADEARIAHVVASRPRAGEVTVDGLTARATFAPNGSDTHAQFIVTGPGPSQQLTTIDLGTVTGGGGPKTLSASLSNLAPGEYNMVSHASNEFGSSESVVHPGFTVPAPPAQITRPATTPPKPKKPTFADVVSIATAKKCIAGRTVKLTLRKRKTGAKVTSVRVTVGHGKPKTYTGKALKPALTLKALPKRGRYQLRVVVTLSDKTKLTLTRTYRACAVKKNH